MFNFIKNTLQKIYTQVTEKFKTVFAGNRVDETTLQELEQILICADTGVVLTKEIIEDLRKQMRAGSIVQGADLKAALEKKLIEILTQDQFASITNDNPSVYMLVGINGSGKTTFAAKLAQQHRKDNKRVLLVAGDTFRAAAVAQLQEWADKLGVSIYTGKPDQDPAAVIFAGCQKFKNEQFDVLIIDTAGRLQTKVNLMKELEKIERVIKKQLPDTAVCTLLTIDSMLGQNSLEQAKLFGQSTHLSGIVLTKMDGTGKGGIVIALASTLHMPIRYISFGEKPEQLKLFDAQEYVKSLLD